MIKTEIIIPLSKRKILLTFLGSIIFVFLGCVFYFKPDIFDEYPGMYIKLVGLITIGFCGLCGIIAFIKLFDKKPGLIIDNSGIIVNIGFNNNVLIKWNNIERLENIKIHGVKMIRINICDNERLIENEPMFSRIINYFKSDKSKSTYTINTTILDCDFQYLVELIQKEIKERKINVEFNDLIVKTDSNIYEKKYWYIGTIKTIVLGIIIATIIITVICIIVFINDPGTFKNISFGKYFGLTYLLLSFLTSIWVFFDAKELGVKEKEIKSTFNRDPGPFGWARACFLLCFIVLPFYLIKRFKRKQSHVNEDQDEKVEGK